MNKKELRQAELLKLIDMHGNLSAKDIAHILHVSQMTIYRDLSELRQDGRLSAELTKAISHQDDDPSSYYLLRAIHESNDQKEKIGQFAASLIDQDDAIILDIGSTIDKMLPYIPEHKNISIICFTANILAKLRHKKGIKILFAGGTYHANTELCESPEGLSFLSRLRANKVFVSAAGIHEDLGLTCVNDYETATKQTNLKSAPEHILVADSDKFGRVHSSYFCGLDEIHSIVTDRNLSSEWRNLLSEKEIVLHEV